MATKGQDRVRELTITTLRLIHLARAADALEYTQEDDDPGSQEAEGQGPADRARVMEALTVYDTQHLLATRHTSQTGVCQTTDLLPNPW